VADKIIHHRATIVSKFIDRLQDTFRGSTPPIGFRKVSEIESPPLLIAVSLTDLSHKELKQIPAADINAAVLNARGLETATFEQLDKAFSNTPIGLLIGDDSDQTDIAQFINRGCDFIIFDLKAPFEVVNREKTGKIVRVDPSLEPGLIRSLNDIPADAVLINEMEPTLTVEHILICYRFAGLLNKPLLLTIKAPLTVEGLDSLRQAGINGLFLDRGFPPGAIADLKKAIDSLPRTPRKKTSAVPLLPRPTTGAQPEIAEEEEED